MKRFIFLLCGLLSASLIFGNNETDSLLHIFDKELTQYKTYLNIRQQRIDCLKDRNLPDLSIEKRYALYQQLYKEYRPYMCDSAILYLDRCIDLGQQANNLYWQAESKIALSYLLASIGFYKEALDMISTIARTDITSEMEITYFDCMNHIYDEAAVYGRIPDLCQQYWHYSDLYRDSLHNLLSYGSDRYLEFEETHYRKQHDFQQAFKINDLRLMQIKTGTPEYALVAYQRSFIYQMAENWEEEKNWLLRSAIADVQQGIADNGSSWHLASIMYKEGDIARAYSYITYSMDNSNIYNARLRHMQIGPIQSIIAQTYQMNKLEQEKKLHIYLLLISILSLLLLLAVIGILIQNKRLSTAHEKTQFVNSQLQELNFELNHINKELKNTNFELLESNHIKEEYIGHFLTLCSSYIDKIDMYRRNLNKKLLAGQTDEVLKIAKSPDFLENEVKLFYNNFDTTFLHLYPDFVKEFNNLLLDEERIILKKDELLNTELRIFALIRLGIDNSAKIAELLRYSSNTIYNYRAKIKNKAKGARDDFESQVMKIGTFTK